MPSYPDLAAPRDDEYSRVTDSSKYRVIGLRVRSWVQALVELELASTVPGEPRSDARVPQTSFWLRPARGSATPLQVFLSQLDEANDSGVDIAGSWIPTCGCDACDSGSETLLDDIDELFVDVLSGELAGDGRSWLD